MKIPIYYPLRLNIDVSDPNENSTNTQGRYFAAPHPLVLPGDAEHVIRNVLGLTGIKFWNPFS